MDNFKKNLKAVHKEVYDTALFLLDNGVMTESYEDLLRLSLDLMESDKEPQHFIDSLNQKIVLLQ